MSRICRFTFDLEASEYFLWSTFVVLFVFFFPLPQINSVKQMMITANDMYGIPPYRLTSYSIGILLGYWLRSEKPKKLSSEALNKGWFLAVACMLLTTILAVTVHVSYTPLNMAIFSAISPILFCSFFGWIIYVSHHNSGSKFIDREIIIQY